MMNAVIVLLIVSVVAWAFQKAFVPPSSVVSGPRPSPGVPNACTVPDAATLAQLIPRAAAGDRDVSRHRSGCTLSGNGRSLRIEISRTPGSRGAGAAEEFARLRQLDALFRRRPPLQDRPGIGDEAFLSRFSQDGAVAARLVTRRDDVVVVIIYRAPPQVPPRVPADPEAYAVVVAGAEAVLADVLAML